MLCSAQEYTVVSCDFENWTNGKPNGCTITGNSTVTQITPGYTGAHACQIQGIFAQIKITENFPMYWGKKYVLSFAAKLISGSRVTFVINNPNDGLGNARYLIESKEVEIDSDWNNYEIEFTTKVTGTNLQYGSPLSCVGNLLTIDFEGNSSNPVVNVIIDDIKLVAKDHTMEFNYLAVNNIKTYIDPIAPFFCPRGGINMFEAPKNSGKSTFWTANLWLGGQDQAGNLHVAAQTYCQSGRDFWLGPISNDFETINGEKVPSNSFIQKYHHTWKVSKAEINYHRAHYADAGYVMPWAIAHWPAHGRTEYGESATLAPFKNVGGNSFYEPEKGDYPLIRGDETVFFIMNDGFDEHLESGGGTPFNLDILGMAYAYNSPDSALQHTIFLSYELRNRSTHHYKNFYFGLWNDFDIGYGDDDYVGCDTSLNLGYGYNGKDVDGQGQSWAYGANPPAQGVMFLNEDMSAFVSFQNSGNGPAIPHRPEDYYNCLQAKYITLGGDGVTGCSGFPTEPTTFMYSGALLADGAAWTEEQPCGFNSSPNTPGDRRVLMRVGPFELPAGASKVIDIALPFARDYGAESPLASVALLKQFALKIQEYYDEHIVGIKETKTVPGKLLVYPNPSNGQFTITSEKVIETIELYDILGKKVFSSTPKAQTTQINTHLSQGLYMYRAVLDDHVVCVGKILVR